jgi:hypothetical protein
MLALDNVNPILLKIVRIHVSHIYNIYILEFIDGLTNLYCMISLKFILLGYFIFNNNEELDGLAVSAWRAIMKVK